MSKRRRRAAIVVDLGFGDAGKGAVTDFLVRSLGATAVVRFNGGAQAGHNVVAPDGRHHTFSQVGAGSFVPGVRTYLSRHVAVHPTALLVEISRLDSLGVRDILERIQISAQALVITPFHQAAGRLRELARGAAKHGSCGVGHGEAVHDSLRHGVESLRAGSLADASLPVILRRIQDRKRAELDPVLRELGSVPAALAERRVLEDPAVVEAWVERIRPVAEGRVIVGDEELAALVDAGGTLAFEGAQGVLLDELHGFHPFTTWSRCDPSNAVELLREQDFDGEVLRLGVLRSYATRHGPGPFPTEVRALDAIAEPHNGHGEWQGAFRRGWLDLVLLRYASAVARPDALAVTHLDAVRSGWQVCDGYRVEPGAREVLGVDGGNVCRRLQATSPSDLAGQEALGRALADAVEPLYRTLPGDPERCLRVVADALQTPVLVAGSGRAARDFRFCDGGTLDGVWADGASIVG